MHVVTLRQETLGVKYIITFFFGPLWAFHKGLWLSGVSAIIISVVITFLTFGLGAFPMMLIYACIFGSRGTRIYYRYRVNNRQTRFG